MRFEQARRRLAEAGLPGIAKPTRLVDLLRRPEVQLADLLVERGARDEAAALAGAGLAVLERQIGRASCRERV